MGVVVDDDHRREAARANAPHRLKGELHVRSCFTFIDPEFTLHFVKYSLAAFDMACCSKADAHLMLALGR
jgi:hypothetical protein